MHNRKLPATYRTSPPPHEVLPRAACSPSQRRHTYGPVQSKDEPQSPLEHWLWIAMYVAIAVGACGAAYCLGVRA